MEWLIGLALAAAGAGLYVFKQRRTTRSYPGPVSRTRPTIEQQKETFDNAWRSMIAAGMQPDGEQARSFIRHVQQALGWNWEPPQE